MAPNALRDSPAPLRSVDENSNIDAKRMGQYQLPGLFGEGGYLWENIDPAKAVWPMTTWCFLTGYMSVFHFPLERKKPVNMNADDGFFLFLL